MKKSFQKKALWIFFGVSIFLQNIFLFTDAFRGDHIDSVKAEQYGSFIGGYIGTFLTLLSIVILYLTLINQRESSDLDKFENKFFELIKIHRENVSNITLFRGKSEGRAAVVNLVRGYRVFLKELRDLSITKEFSEKFTLDQKSIFSITFLLFFYGLGDNSYSVLRDSLKDYDNKMVELIINHFKRIDTIEKKSKEDGKRTRDYFFTEGQQSRLDHYFKHLFLSIKYVDDNKDLLDNKEFYVDLLKAQISKPEQALISFAVNSKYCKDLESVGLIVDINDLINNYNLRLKNFIDLSDQYWDESY